MPAFTFEKILPEKMPQVRPGPVPAIQKKPRGVIVQVLDRFVAARMRRTLRKDNGVIAHREQGPRD
jgi:hypothetical protein